MVHRLRAPLSRMILFLALLWPLLGAGAAQAQEGPPKWQPTGGPAGRLTQLAASQNGQDVYAVSAATVNRKEDDQTQWLNTGVPTEANALYVSRDAGATWQPLTNDLPPSVITALYVDHRDWIWLGLQMREDLPGRRDGLWQSTDRGATWRQVALDRNDVVIVSIAESADKQLVLGAVDAGGFEPGIVYRTTDEGASWTSRRFAASDLAPGVRLSRLAPHPTKPNIFFVTTSNGDLLRSTDTGETWSTMPGTKAGERGSAQLAFAPDLPETALLVQTRQTAVGVQRSTDGGASWSNVTASGLSDGARELRSMLALPHNILLINTDAGTYRSADGGARWQPLEGALSSGVVYAMVGSNGERVLAATEHGLFESTDAGAVWRAFGSGLPSNKSVRALLTHPDRPAFLAAAPMAVNDVNPTKLLLARDSGRTWFPAQIRGFWGRATGWAIDPSNADNLYVAGADYIATSKDGGFSWTVHELKAALGAQHNTIVVAPSDGSIVYVDGSPALRSRDGGQTWTELSQAADSSNDEGVTALAVDPTDASHLWSGGADGVWESRDGGNLWLRAGLDGQPVEWLAATGGVKDEGPLALFAGLAQGGLMRLAVGTGWQTASGGMPAGTLVTAFAADPRIPGLVWAARDGAGVYRSSDGGNNWTNVAAGMGDNLVSSLAINYQTPGSVFAGTASAGIWLLSSSSPTPRTTATPESAPPTSTPTDASGRAGVDARIEVVWPHGFAAIDTAQFANVGIRLFIPRSLQPPSCNWRAKVQLWRAVNTEPAEPVETAEQRSVDGQPFPYWDANDVDVSKAREAGGKVYFMVLVDGVDTATSVWAHAADARTYFPEQQVPSGLATGPVGAVDARIQIVWPHDRQGAEVSVEQADLVNVSVSLFKHGTRLSVPVSWPGQVSLYGAWNAEVARPFSIRPVVNSKQAGAITYPVWEFNDVPADRARDGSSKLYLWATVKGVMSYPTIWAHGVDSRTYFPAKDEPIQGCLP